MGKERERREEEGREKGKSRIHHHLAPALVFQIETFLSDLRAVTGGGEGDVVSRIHFHKDNLRHLPRFPDFFVTFRILSSLAVSSSLFLYLTAKKGRILTALFPGLRMKEDVWPLLVALSSRSL